MNIENLNRFKSVDTSDLPNFYDFDRTLEQALWILWVAKDKLKIVMLKADDISQLLIKVKEISVSTKSVINAFKRAEGKIHIHKESNGIFYEIMKLGKEHLASKVSMDSVKLYYFEPGKKYTCKKLITESIFDELKGELKIVDPYCDSGTLDILTKSKKQNVKFLTQINKLNSKKKQQFVKDLKDFKNEYSTIEFRSYSNSDIHDRYIISNNKFVILGYSLKDLGAKESFGIILDIKMCNDILDGLIENFNRRWKIADIL